MNTVVDILRDFAQKPRPLITKNLFLIEQLKTGTGWFFWDNFLLNSKIQGFYIFRQMS